MEKKYSKYYVFVFYIDMSENKKLYDIIKK